MRAIDADVWFEQIDADHCASCSRPCPCSKCGLGIARESIENTPTIDAVRVVRCKDCQWWDQKDDSSYGYCRASDHWYRSKHWEISIYRVYQADWFCADGERREDDAKEST